MHPPPPPSQPLATGSSSTSNQTSRVARLRDSATDRAGTSRAGTELSQEGMLAKPVKVERGLFRGRWMKFVLSVEQEPVLGRRKTEKDRRPLGPSPIVRFRAIECRKRAVDGGAARPGAWADEWDEEELDPSAYDPAHLICAAGLRPPPAEQVQPGTGWAQASSGTTGASTGVAGMTLERDPVASDKDIDMLEDEDTWEGSHTPLALADAPGEDVGLSQDGPGPSSSRHRIAFTPRSRAPPAVASRYLDAKVRPRPSEGDGSMDSSVGGHSTPTPWGQDRNWTPESSLHSDTDEGTPLFTEGKRPRSESVGEESSGAAALRGGMGQEIPARNLYGSLHTTGVKVPGLEGDLGTWFLFTDLSIRQEGVYSLQFRCFDVTATDSAGVSPAPPLVECHSQSFRIYSPRQVPPLPKPTELAEHFGKQGFKLNTRKNERTVASPPRPSPPPRPPPAPAISSRPTARPIQPAESVKSSSPKTNLSTGSSDETRTPNSPKLTVHELSGDSGPETGTIASGASASTGISLSSLADQSMTSIKSLDQGSPISVGVAGTESWGAGASAATSAYDTSLEVSSDRVPVIESLGAKSTSGMSALGDPGNKAATKLAVFEEEEERKEIAQE